jgi:broad specificity phosphatase PhoE
MTDAFRRRARPRRCSPETSTPSTAARSSVTRETAEIVGEACDLVPIATDRLVEIGLGDLDGKNQDDPVNKGAFDAVLARWTDREMDARFPNGESLKEASDRVGLFLEDLPADANRILVVGHCITFACALWVKCDAPGNRFNDVILKRGHLAVLNYDDGRLTLVEMNAAP